MEMLASFEPQFRYFYKWWIQLFAESEGKENKGIFPVAGEFSEELSFRRTVYPGWFTDYV